MIEIPEVLREVWNFLVMQKIEVLSIPPSIPPILFEVLNYIWDWLKRKRDEKKRAAEFFEVCKKTEKLMPEDFE